MKNLILFFFLFSLCFLSYSQPRYLPLNRDIHHSFGKVLNSKASGIHTSIKPYLISELSVYTNVDSLLNIFHTDSGSFVRRKLKNEKLIRFIKEPFRLYIDPLFSLMPGFDLSGSNTVFESTIGFAIQGSYSEKISFSVNFLNGNSSFVSYLDSVIQKTKVVPGLGYAHKTSLGYDYSIFSGYVSYSPSKYFNFQLGNDKNFIGDGYRSLLLSDNSYNYPFFKISTNVWKLKYVNLYTAYSDIRNSNGDRSKFRSKFSTTHYLSWNISKRINIGLFETIIWQGKDSSGTRGFDVNYLNPVIFFRPVEYSLGSSDNALLGLNVKLKIAKNQQLYGQIILDEFFLKEVKARNGWWSNKQGFQVGVKSFDIFKIRNLDFQTEFNYVRPYTYSHGNSIQNYAHFNQPLAHPLSANFYESVSFIRYRYKNWIIETKFLYALYGGDTSLTKSWGGNIFLDYRMPCKPCMQDYNNVVAQGIKTLIVFGDLKISYLINPKTNLRLEAGISNRFQSSVLKSEKTNFIYIGLRTAIANVYHDL